MNGINELFELFCYVLLSKKQTSVYSIKLNQLEECIKRKISVDNSVVPEEFEEETDIILNAVTYREKSPFGRRFELIYKNILVSPEVQNYPQNDPDNIAYTPQIVEFLLTYYMPLLPLWSGIILIY